MGDGTPKGAASPGSVSIDRAPTPEPAPARSHSRRFLLLLIVGALLVSGVEFVLLRTFANLGEVGRSISTSTEPVSLQVLDSGVDDLHVRTEELLSGATTDPSALQQQVSRVDAEIRVVTQAATGSPGRTRDVEEIRRAFLDYVSEVSPTFTYGRAAIGPRTESTITALVRAVQVAHQREVVRSHQDLVESLDASRVARSILVALAILLGLLGVTAGMWFWRTSRRIREEVTTRHRMQHERDVAEARYRNLIEHIPAVTYVDRVDPVTGEIHGEYISPQVERLCGYGIEVWIEDPGFWKRILDPRDRAATLDEDHRTKITGDDFLREFRLIAKDGRIVWVRDEATLGPPDADGVRRWQGVMLDVTAQKAADENLRLLESAVVNTADAVMITAADLEPGHLVTLFVNPAFERLSGYTAEEFVGTDPMVLLGPGSDDDIVEDARRELAAGRAFTGENVNYRKDGTPYHVAWRTAPILDEQGTATHLVTTMQDITKRVEADQRIREAEERFRTLVEQIPAATYLDGVLDPVNPLDLTPEYISPRITQMTGYSTEQWMFEEDFWIKVLHPDDRQRVMETSQQALDQQRPYSEEYRMITADGRVIWVSEDSTVIRDENGRPVKWLGVYVDQTARKEAMQRLAETEEKYRALVEQIPAILYVDIFGPEMVTAYVSPQIEEILGITQEEYLNDPELWVRQMHPDDREARLAGYLERMTESLDERRAVQYRMVRPDGGVVWIDDRSTILFDAEGKPAFVQGLMLDITAVKVAEEELKRSRALLAGAERMAALGSWEHDPETGETEWSDELFRIYGIDPVSTAPSYQAYLDVIHPEERDTVAAAVMGGLTSGAGYNIEHRIRRPDGSIRYVHQVGRVRKDDVSGRIRWSGTIQDVTERREAERERERNLDLLRRAGEERQTLLRHLVDAQEEERERIAGDIHDDPIQKMTAVGMRIDAARRKVTDIDQMRVLAELSEVVQVSITSLRHLLFDLRPRALDQDGLGAAIRVYLEQVEGEGLRSRLDDRLIEELPPDLRTIAYRIAQEAISNARKHSRASFLDVELMPVDNGVLVRVKDDGVGFDPEQTDLSEPELHFGLGSMRQRAEMAGGWWRATSARGAGTTVEFWLPLRRDDATRDGDGALTVRRVS